MEEKNRQVLEERAHFVCQLQMNQEIYWEYIRTILTRSKQFFISVCFTVMLSLFAITELDMSYVFTFAAIVIVNVIIWVRLKNNYRDLEKRKTNAASYHVNARRLMRGSVLERVRKSGSNWKNRITIRMAHHFFI